LARDREYDEAREEFGLRVSHYAEESDAAALGAPDRVPTIRKGQGVTTRVVELRQGVQIPDITAGGGPMITPSGGRSSTRASARCSLYRCCARSRSSVFSR
jgi:hypothetical protein